MARAPAGYSTPTVVIGLAARPGSLAGHRRRPAPTRSPSTAPPDRCLAGRCPGTPLPGAADIPARYPSWLAIVTCRGLDLIPPAPTAGPRGEEIGRAHV